MAKRTDISECAAPDEVPDTLRALAQRMIEDAGDLESAWQDKQAGHPWIMIARILERAADQIERKLP